jgi:16S rRNA (cytosine967-C5)-methyltransferase
MQADKFSGRIESPREAAFLALCAAEKGEAFLSESLSRWLDASCPPDKDFRLAQEIAFGTQRRLLSLDYLAKQGTTRHTLPSKLKEKILLRMGLYQHFFMDRIPDYAIVDESIRLARRYCHASFASFLNAALRRLLKITLNLPEDDSLQGMSVSLSYPPFFIEKIVQEYGLVLAKEILEVLNRPPILMARDRRVKECRVDRIECLKDVISNSDYYIQNITQATLLFELSKQIPHPSKILDLCAAPGGKLIALYDLFGASQLFANDASSLRLKKLEENLEKYGIRAEVSCQRAEEFSSEHTFDLIVLDVPCSNSGVLHKRPEARMRLGAESLEALKKVQFACLKNAVSLLAPGGQIWYLTCSILKEENEEIVEKALQELPLKLAAPFLKKLPNAEGWDGGFAAAFSTSAKTTLD